MLDRIPSVEVTAWTDDFLRTVVCNVTDSFNYASVAQKDHILYLNSYLGCLKAKTVVLEGSYIDQNYLDDYQGYYSSCFPHHSKCCTRLHFFSNAFDESKFLSHLAKKVSGFDEELKNSYLGYIVIRPIPDTFIAKLCLAVYERTKSDRHRLIQKDNRVNLFGLKLSVRSAPFTEKDRVVSACATSSIWTLLCSSSHYDRNTFPSPSAITKFALNGSNDSNKGFPVLGLEPIQVCRTLQHYGLEANEVVLKTNDTTNKNSSILKNHAVAYLTNNIPFILAGVVYAIDKSTNKLKRLDNHAICVLGYRYSDSHTHSSKYRNRATNLDKLYAHDDRYGPYLSLEFSDEVYMVEPLKEIDKSLTQEPKEVSGLKIHLDKDNSEKNECDFREVFVPDRIILAKHHKARVSYSNIEQLIENFIISITYFESASHEHNSVQNEDLDAFGYEIKLWNSSDYKTFCTTLKTPFYFNGVKDKVSLLCKSLPKHIWVCSIYQNNDLIGDILFDATEIIQGRPLIGYVALNEYFHEFWIKLAKKEVINELEQVFKDLGVDQSNLFNTYVKFLSGSENLMMNIRYGEPKLVYRQFKTDENNTSTELDNFGKVINKPNVQIQKFKSFWTPAILQKSNKYIWLIDTDGDLYYGIEDKESELYKGGHPTLNSTRPSRLGGELKFNPSTKNWEINSISGAYSKHISNKTEARTRLTVVIENNFCGWEKSDKPVIKFEPL
jgi:hypothetical protein